MSGLAIGYGILLTFNQGCLWIIIFPISTSQVAEITGLSQHAWPVTNSFFGELHMKNLNHKIKTNEFICIWFLKQGISSLDETKIILDLALLSNQIIVSQCNMIYL
jgi:hypothetical protein